MKNKLLIICMAMLLVMVPLTVSAQGYEMEQTGSISVTLVAEAELALYHVASAEFSDEGKLRYHYTDDFADCSFPLEDTDLAQKLDAHVTKNSVACRKIITDSKGIAVWKDLPLGMYFVKQTGNAVCTSFLVTVPMETADGFVYHVDASPKTEAVRVIDLTIRKVWNTDEAKPACEHVTVQLLRNKTVVDTVTLSADNHWQVTCTDLPESDGYSIQEIHVPKGFTATYSHTGSVFTVTNTPTLVQTGQTVWTIPVFATAGMFLLLMGFAILRKQGKEHA